MMNLIRFGERHKLTPSLWKLTGTQGWEEGGGGGGVGVGDRIWPILDVPGCCEVNQSAPNLLNTKNALFFIFNLLLIPHTILTLYIIQQTDYERFIGDVQQLKPGNLTKSQQNYWETPDTATEVSHTRCLGKMVVIH